MSRFFRILVDARTLSLIGLAALAGFLFFGASALEVALGYAGIALGLFVLILGLVWAFKKIQAYRASQALESAMDESAALEEKLAPSKNRADVSLLRTRMQDAVNTIKQSKLGLTTGRSALYELPWYMVIGNPAAGKSTAVVKSGLKFPFADNTGNIIQGIGGTRNCDWFFTSEGILLDTAGRYSVHEEDRQEWMGFLSLLKKHRPKAPINGIIIAVSLSEIAEAKPQACIQLAKSLRQRVQELTESLEVFAPVYLVFTKADLISGFTEFFAEYRDRECEKVWGATLPYDPESHTDAVSLFDKHFECLRDGLKEELLANMTLHRGRTLPPGVLSFPLEFAALKPALQSFIATLFEENPYQFRPIFRGFYFTSALHEGVVSSSASNSVVQQFNLQTADITVKTTETSYGYFLKDLFSKVIFADKELVKQYSSRPKQRLRLTVFAGGVLVLALALAGWGSAYLGNRQLMADVSADMDKVVRLQQDRMDLATRMEAMEVLQERIEQLDRWKTDRPWSVGLGLYQGASMEKKLREEYFSGVSQLMLVPVGQSIELFLAEVNKNSASLAPMTKPPTSAAQPSGSDDDASAFIRTEFVQAKPTRVEDAYNALKTYLMLNDKSRIEQGHLTDQISRFWRGWLESNRGAMPYERMAQSGEKMLSFTLANINDPAFPVLENNFALVDQSRENLRRVVRGMPARERVYSEIKARAATRFPSITVTALVGEQDIQTVAGAYAISGTFSRQAWTDYVEDAIKKAASEELQSVDWVLKTSSRDDLSLEGSPDQIRKALTDLYKKEYVQEWQRFLQGISINEFANFDDAVKRMDRLGDSNRSPIKKLVTALHGQTSWDNPSLLNEQLGRTQQGFMAWFKQSILRLAPSRVDLNVNLSGAQSEVPMGPIGQEFASLQRIMMSRDNSPTLMAGYLDTLSKLRTKFNQIKNQGDAGPEIKKLMGQTLDGGTSELADALRFVDEQMLVGMSETAKTTLRPLLVRPLIQSFSVMVKPVETEVNRIWLAQVHEIFMRTLSDKYPFSPTSKVEASPGEIAKILGPDGAISKFSVDALGPLIVRRGDTLVSRTWADIGIAFTPDFTNGFSAWVAPLDGTASSAQSSSAEGSAAQKTVFQVLPLGASGLLEYSMEIDGQVMRYRNTAAAWTNFFWPNPAGVPGVKITGVTNDGRNVDLLNEPGRFGLDRLFSVASKKSMPDGSTELSWSKDGATVAVQLRIISQPGATAARKEGAAQAPKSSGLQGLRLPALIASSEVPPSGQTASANDAVTAHRTP